ncbi:putative translation initiation factor eIF-2B subunit delta [Cytospora mali]|uniref:Translation initiation factor eIF2B subunit delta n=1 Tax=Cytospora mali TaxID=578113 RepID=A0A194ULV7_CYTMA|nr:putative translation initiation factor eIF-2B subunit delta [Valsa mali var. pyri (nom. inval.)]
MAETAPAAAQAATPAPAPATPSADPAASASKLSGAELKAKKKAEKAARREQSKAAEPAPAPAAASAAGHDKQNGGKQSKPKQDAPGASAASRSKKSVPTPAPIIAPKQPQGPVVPESFSHLPMARKLPLSKADKDVHPAVLAIGQQMASFTLKDGVARLEATLMAFRKIDYLTECRPMSFSMGNAIRMLKSRIAKLDLDQSDENSREQLCQAIDLFIQERIFYAEDSIISKATSMISDGDTILTYGHQRLVRKALLAAKTKGSKFEVAIVDDPFERSGQELAKMLRSAGLRVYYYPSLAGLSINVRRASKIFLGAEAMFANGSLYGPAGTCDIAIAARDAEVPVIALLETVNFDRDRVSVDSLTYNEIDPERNTAESLRLLFDTTRDKYVSIVVTESEEGNAAGATSAILPVLRKMDERS